MAIRIYENKIEFEDDYGTTFTLNQTDDGFDFAHKLSSTGTFALFQGTVSGYVTGGPGNVIEKFPFATNTNSADVGDLTGSFTNGVGVCSQTHGYVTGGDSGVTRLRLDKFPFATDSNAVTSGSILDDSRYEFKTPNASLTHGYVSSGTTAPGTTSSGIQRFNFAIDGNAFNVGSLTVNKRLATGQSSATHGYTSGGTSPPGTTFTNLIEKFSFAAEGAPGKDVGDLTLGRERPAGQSSITHGYSSGGFVPPAVRNVIDKFPFATDTNATDVGDLTQSRNGAAAQSSTTNGYTCGGNSPPGVSNVIDRFPFATDSSAADVGDLLTAKAWLHGHQS
jgi:hypothetical protein